MTNHTCGRCNRPLKTEKSMIVGYGPWCLKKMQEQQEQPPEGQTTIDEYIPIALENARMSDPNK